METIVRTRRIGGSLVATLPRSLVEALNIHKNELLKLDVKQLKRDYFGSLKGAGKFTKEDELNTHD